MKDAGSRRGPRVQRDVDCRTNVCPPSWEGDGFIYFSLQEIEPLSGPTCHHTWCFTELEAVAMYPGSKDLSMARQTCRK